MSNRKLETPSCRISCTNGNGNCYRITRERLKSCPNSGPRLKNTWTHVVALFFALILLIVVLNRVMETSSMLDKSDTQELKLEFELEEFKGSLRMENMAADFRGVRAKFDVQEGEDGLCAGKSLLIVIKSDSSTRGRELRSASRSTWLKDLPASTTYKFFVGQSLNMELTLLKQEITEFGDIIFVDVPYAEEYGVYKTYSTLLWKQRYCESAEHLLHVHDNTVVHVPRLLDWLERGFGGQLDGLKEYVVCNDNSDREISTDNNSGWSILPNSDRKAFYPKYCNSNGILLRSSAVSSLLSVAKNVSNDIHTEDVLFYGVIREQAGIPLVSFSGFQDETKYSCSWDGIPTLISVNMNDLTTEMTSSFSLLRALSCEILQLLKDSPAATPVEQLEDSTEFTNSTPTVLFWNNINGKSATTFFDFPSKCPYRCHFTDERSASPHAKAVVFNVENLNVEDLPKARDSIHIVLYKKPIKSEDISALSTNFFHWTMGYRTDSTIYLPNGEFLEFKEDMKEYEYYTKQQVEEAVSKKTRRVLYINKECGGENGLSHRKREYISEFAHYTNVTTISNCPQNGNPDGNVVKADEMKTLIADHHFLLLLDDPVCPGYVSEDFFKLSDLIVPIVWSKNAMSFNIPHDSYISTSDFEVPEDLAGLVNELAADHELYKRYFSWTKKFMKPLTLNDSGQLPNSYVDCYICKLLHQKSIAPLADTSKFFDNDHCIFNYADGLTSEKSSDDWKSWAKAERALADFKTQIYRKRNFGIPIK